MPKIIRLCAYKVGGVWLLTGVWKDTIYTNVLNDLFDVIGPDANRYNRNSGDLEMIRVMSQRSFTKHTLRREVKIVD